MSKNLLKVKKSSTAMAIFQSRQCLFQSSHFVDKKTRTVLSCFRYFAIAHTPTQTSARKACLFLYSFPHMRRRKLCGISLSLIPLHKLRHAKRAYFYILSHICAGASCVVFRYRSYPYTNFGTQSVLIFIFVSVVVQSTA